MKGRPLGARWSLPSRVAHGGADGHELGEVVAPRAAADLQADGHDPVGAELVGLLLHARHRELARVVHRLGEDVHLLVAAPRPHLKADVVDRGPHDEPQRLEAGGPHEQELVDREVAGEERAIAHPLQALAPVLGHAGHRGGVVGLLLLLVAHGTSRSSGRARYFAGGGAAWRTSTIAVPSTCSSMMRSRKVVPPASRSRPCSLRSMVTPTTPWACSACACAGEALHGQRPRVVHPPRVVGQLLVLAPGEQPRRPRLLRPARDHVGDRRAGDDADRPEAVADELGEVLAGQVRDDRRVLELVALGAHRGADGDELDEPGGPLVAAAAQAHADHRVGPDGQRLVAQAAERERARVVPRVGLGLELEGVARAHRPRPAALAQRHRLPAHLVEAAAHHLRDRREAGLADHQRLGHAEIGAEGPRHQPSSSRASAWRPRSLRSASSTRSCESAAIQASRSSSWVFSAIPRTTERRRQVTRPRSGSAS